LSSTFISKDKNLELDPYFYERQKELHQINFRQSIKKYTIVYQVSLERNTIEMMKIFKKNKPSQH